MLLDGIRQLREHRLAANLHLVVPNAYENLRLERVREDVGVALHLTRRRRQKTNVTGEITGRTLRNNLHSARRHGQRICRRRHCTLDVFT